MHPQPFVLDVERELPGHDIPIERDRNTLGKTSRGTSKFLFGEQGDFHIETDAEAAGAYVDASFDLSRTEGDIIALVCGVPVTKDWGVLDSEDVDFLVAVPFIVTIDTVVAFNPFLD
ncbi:hypothetical protein E1B28_003556 [Marasmius oreades]|uniref:Uncharacterized protein n=1 Tax=Marasmius oreades TaxID=181124 RepID=A0A9P7RMU0_9AGAR|nr:uncharacterized protein E1B28_003556 [Marasmius oreades]KAG7086035.1 hypothetical protein E1B28_003556 [Marasmius oreades]